MANLPYPCFPQITTSSVLLQEEAFSSLEALMDHVQSLTETTLPKLFKLTINL
jgi:hypothetical protein